MPDEPPTPDLAELLRLGYEASSRGDLDTVMGLYDPDAVWEVRGLGARFEGVAQIRCFIEDWRGAYEDWSLVAEEIVDLGNGAALVVAVQTGRPFASSGHVRYRFAQVITLHDGVIVRVVGYNDIDQARAAAERLAESRG
jgi:ketosteroid isomerase-like protein